VISADGAVVTACYEPTTCIEDVLISLSLVQANLQHGTIKTEIGIVAGSFEIKVLTKRQLATARFKDIDTTIV
jgi:hypothetical protein